MARLGDAIREVDPGLEPWTPLIGILLGLDLPDTPETAALGERFIRDRLSEVAIQFLGELLAGAPSIFIVEDIHHLDEASHDLLLRVSRAAADRRQVLIVTRQGTGEPFAHSGPGMPETIVLELAPLGTEALIEIIDAATEDDPLPRHEVDEIARRSGGNALFLFELLEGVRETGSVDSLPDSIESMIAGEIDRLPPSDRTILRYAAVLGASFDPEMLAHAVGDDVDLDDAVWARLDGLLSPEASGTLRFRNTLIRDAAYEGLPYRRRRILHDRVGQAIEDRAGISLDEEVGTLAMHYYEAQRWDKAWVFCRRAADRAMGIYANVDAVRAYEEAITAGQRLRSVTRVELAEIHERIGDVRYNLNQPELAEGAYKAARRLSADDAAGSARVAHKQAVMATSQGRYQVAIRRVSRALSDLDGVPGSDVGAARARLYVWKGWIRMAQDRPGETIELCHLGVEEAKLAGATADEVLAQAYQILDAAYTEHGEIEKATYSAMALNIYERLGNLAQQAWTLNNMGVIAKERSSWTESRELYDRARVLFEAIGNRGDEAVAKFNIAEILSDQGHFEEAERLLREVVRVWRAAGAGADVAEARRELGKAAGRRGDFDAALALFAEAKADQLAHGQPGEALATDVRTAEVLVMAGRNADALALADDAMARVGEVDGGTVLIAALQRVRGWVHLREGQLDAARTAFLEARDGALYRADDYQVALALDGLIAVGEADGTDVGSLRSERLEIHERLGIVTGDPLAAGPGA